MKLFLCPCSKIVPKRSLRISFTQTIQGYHPTQQPPSSNKLNRTQSPIMIKRSLLNNLVMHTALTSAMLLTLAPFLTAVAAIIKRTVICIIKIIRLRITHHKMEMNCKTIIITHSKAIRFHNRISISLNHMLNKARMVKDR